jgi:type I restriction enzyme, S subunit
MMVKGMVTDMTKKTFFANFGYLADAPNGVKKLRELVLMLAVRGKLVPQYRDDEPAGKLLERIRVEKGWLVKEKKIKKVEPMPAVTADEAPYELPEGWEWSRLAEIGIVNPTNDVGDDVEASFIPMALISEKYGKALFSETKIWSEIKKGFTHFAENDVVLAKITPCFQNGKSAVMRGLKNGVGAGTTELHVFRQLSNTVYPDYVLIYLKSSEFINNGIPKMTGSAGQKRVPKEYFSLNPFPLAPIAEQYRIVAKVDQLMALCDELETRQQKKKQKLLTLNNTALDQLLTAYTTDNFTNAWRLIRDNFDFLYTTPETITKLRQAILQLAVQGKLVPQDSNDEPTYVLLAKIKAEKERLVKGKKIRKSEPLPPVSSDEVPFKLPEGWEWVRLGMLCSFLGGFAFKSDTYVPRSTYQIIRLGNVKNDALLLHVSPIFIPENIAEENNKYRIKPNDILITMTGTKNKNDYGYSVLISEKNLSSVNLYLNQRVGCLRCYKPELSTTINMFLKSNPIINMLLAKGTGTANQGNIGSGNLSELLFPLPPLHEQYRIITKVDQLMKLCNELESYIIRSQTKSEKLAEAAMTVIAAN